MVDGQQFVSRVPTGRNCRGRGLLGPIGEESSSSSSSSSRHVVLARNAPPLARRTSSRLDGRIVGRSMPLVVPMSIDEYLLFVWWTRVALS